MKLAEAYEILKKHQNWRRGDDDEITMCDAPQLTEAIFVILVFVDAELRKTKVKK